MSKQNLIILNIGIISILVYLTSLVLDIYNPYMNLEGTLGFTLPLFVVVVIYLLIYKIIKK